MKFKKIAVCHGKVCGPAGAQKIKDILEEKYSNDGIEVVERTCCGRCERNNSIVIDDEIIISDLSLKNIEKCFIVDTEDAIERAQKEKQESEKKLENILADDLLL